MWFGRAPDHLLGLGADGQRPATVDVDRHDRRLVEHDALAAHVDEGVGGPEVDGHVSAHERSQPVSHCNRPIGVPSRGRGGRPSTGADHRPTSSLVTARWVGIVSAAGSVSAASLRARCLGQGIGAAAAPSHASEIVPAHCIRLVPLGSRPALSRSPAGPERVAPAIRGRRWRSPGRPIRGRRSRGRGSRSASMPRSPRIVPGAASRGLVAPISCRTTFQVSGRALDDHRHGRAAAHERHQVVVEAPCPRAPRSDGPASPGRACAAPGRRCAGPSARGGTRISPTSPRSTASGLQITRVRSTRGERYRRSSRPARQPAPRRPGGPDRPRPDWRDWLGRAGPSGESEQQVRARRPRSTASRRRRPGPRRSAPRERPVQALVERGAPPRPARPSARAASASSSEGSARGEGGVQQITRSNVAAPTPDQHGGRDRGRSACRDAASAARRP